MTFFLALPAINTIDQVHDPCTQECRKELSIARRESATHPQPWHAMDMDLLIAMQQESAQKSVAYDRMYGPTWNAARGAPNCSLSFK